MEPGRVRADGATEVRPLGNAVPTSFPFALPTGKHCVATVLLNPDGFEVALDE
jgi:hypothetical protein